MPKETETVTFDFADNKKADSEKWKEFMKDAM